MRFILALIFTSISSIGFSQTLERTTISSTGNSVTDANGITYMQNVGGLVVNTTSNAGGVQLTQGFEQPSGEVIPVLDPDIPNAFSPNGDAINDTWIIKLPVEMIGNSTVTIFNRWGDELAKIIDYDNIVNVWDGTSTLTGQFVTGGTYFFVIESVIASRSERGWVQVMR